MGSVRVNFPHGFNILAISARKSRLWMRREGQTTPDNTTSKDELGWDAVKETYKYCSHIWNPITSSISAGLF